MVSWLSDRVLSIRETLGITPTVFIEIIIFFSLRRSLSQWLDVFQRLRLLGEQLHQLVPGPSLLQRTGRRSGEDQRWRRKRVCTEAGEQCAPSLRQVWLALEWNPQRKAFIWADNSIPTFKKWFAGEPNGNAHEPCSNFWTRENPPGINGHWNDLSCWNQNVPCGIVCKRLP